jgi:peroxiredoxin
MHFGIDLPGCNGEESWTLPMPARYVIDKTGTICSARVHADYTHRPDPSDTLTALAALRA